MAKAINNPIKISGDCVTSRVSMCESIDSNVSQEFINPGLKMRLTLDCITCNHGLHHLQGATQQGDRGGPLQGGRLLLDPT